MNIFYVYYLILGTYNSLHNIPSTSNPPYDIFSFTTILPVMHQYKQFIQYASTLYSPIV